MYHTPKQSEALFHCINSLIINEDYKLIDCSYKNDVTDSADCKNAMVKVYFPNIPEAFNESVGDENYDYFSVRFGAEEYIEHSFTLLEVVSLINSFDRKLEIEGFEVRMIDFIKDNCDAWDNILHPVISLEIDNCAILDLGAGGRTYIDRIS